MRHNPILKMILASLPLLALSLIPSVGLSKALKESVIVNWRKLASLKLGSMEKSQDIQALENQKVRIVGFIMPLEGDEKAVTEFLLVPALACLYTCPPAAAKPDHFGHNGKREKSHL